MKSVFERKKINLLFVLPNKGWGIPRADGAAWIFCGLLCRPSLCAVSIEQTAGRGGCWEGTGHLFWQVPLCCRFWWNRNNHQSIRDLNPDRGSAWISATEYQLKTIKLGRHLEQVFYSNLFLFRRFQASNYQASPMKIAEPAVDLLSLGETPLDG